VPFDSTQVLDSLGRPVWFGTGLSDAEESDDRYVETTCGVQIEDAVDVAVEAEIGSQQVVDEGNSLVLGIPELQDVNNDGDFGFLGDQVLSPTVAGRAVEYTPPVQGVQGAQQVDQGLFVQSHDDQGGIASGAGEIIVSPDANGFDPVANYDDDGDGDVSAPELLDAIDDWRNNEISAQELLEVLDVWRS
jgi:hypothetical protein